jgi:hypothetical protein
MSISDPTVLVSCDWLKDRLGTPDIRILDASWHLPAANRSGRKEFEDEHIPGALFFDIDEIADTSSPLPHMMPPAEKFSSRVRKLGIGDGTMVVDARIVLKTHDGAIIHMTYGGRIVIPESVLGEARDPDKRQNIPLSRYYFRTTPVFETGAPEYAWLNNIVCVGSGRLLKGRSVAYEVFQIL